MGHNSYTSCAILIREASATGPSIVATFRIIANVQGNARGKICTPNLVSLAGPSPFSEAVTNNACKSTRQACAMVQQMMIELYPVRSMGDQSLCYVGEDLLTRYTIPYRPVSRPML